MRNKTIRILLTISIVCLLTVAVTLLILGLCFALAAAPTGVLPPVVIYMGVGAMVAALAGGVSLAWLWMRLRE